ncbi:MAG: HEAT repeat domain-containing protein [SAR324 cluster bacterium]|nr:HEAT repeat domain-containing protein [SAR324 cluster bacterium]
MKVTFKKLQKKLIISLVMLVSGMMIPSALYAQNAEQIMPLLKGYEWKLQPEQFQNLGEDTDLVLMEIAADTSLMNAFRFRALEALKLFEKDRVADFLETYLEQNQSSSHLRRAFEAFSKGFSGTQPDRVQQVARKLLLHSNPHVRISAARTLRTLDTSSARSAYRTHLDTEEEWVRKAIEQ